MILTKYTILLITIYNIWFMDYNLDFFTIKILSLGIHLDDNIVLLQFRFMHTFNNNKYHYGILYVYSIYNVFYIFNFIANICYIYWIQNKIIKEQGFRLSQFDFIVKVCTTQPFYKTSRFFVLILYYVTILTGQYNIICVALLFIFL